RLFFHFLIINIMSWTENKWLKPAWMGGGNDFVTKYQDKFAKIGEKFAPKVVMNNENVKNDKIRILDQTIRWIEDQTTLYAEFKVMGLEYFKGGLQIIQIVSTTLEEATELSASEPGSGELIISSNPKNYIDEDNVMVHPKSLKERDKKGRNYWKFVDAGRYSPKGMTDGEAVKGKPYYLSKKTLSKDIIPDNHFDGTGEAVLYYEDVENNIAIIRTMDQPYAIVKHEIISFQTIVVGVNYKGTAKDLLIGSFLWGFKNGGKFDKIDKQLRVGFISEETIKVIANDYSNYRYQILT
ncbi:MAG: hypothetical protein ACKVTZ_10150, partial [Bacteroidia bacterium]